MARVCERRDLCTAMNKKTKRLFLGLASSLLLAIGFARAADRMDPLVQTLGNETNSNFASTAAEPCSEPCTTGCNFLDEKNA